MSNQLFRIPLLLTAAPMILTACAAPTPAATRSLCQPRLLPLRKRLFPRPRLSQQPLKLRPLLQCQQLRPQQCL